MYISTEICQTQMFDNLLKQNALIKVLIINKMLLKMCPLNK